MKKINLEKKKICKCGHLLSEHFEPSNVCGEDIGQGMADGLINYCRHCEENSIFYD